MLGSMTPEERQARLEELAVRANVVEQELLEINRAEEAEGLTTEQLGALQDRRTLAEHEKADIARELRALDGW